MRWAATATLVGVSEAQRADGSFSEGREEREVFCNERSVGTSAWLAARAAGLHADAEIELRACDYDGQSSCTLRGVEYEVESARSTGETCTLTLRRRLRGE